MLGGIALSVVLLNVIAPKTELSTKSKGMPNSEMSTPNFANRGQHALGLRLSTFI
jgi:hypothetical protein